MKLVLGIWIVAWLAAAAQPPIPARLGQRHWTSAQGLPQDAVLAMTQTSDGYLWLATEGGLARFDGVRFTTFDRKNYPALGTNFVQALVQDPSGTLWIGTAGSGLARYRNGQIERVASWPASAGSTVYSLFVEKDGALWAGTEKGLSRLGQNSVQHFRPQDGFPSSPVYSITQTTDGAIWFATYGSGLGRYSGGTVQLWNRAAGLADDRAILVEAEGADLWVALYGGRLQRYHNGHLVEIIAAARGPANRGIWAIRRGRGGRLWVGSFGAGLGEVIGTSLIFNAINPPIDADSVWSLLEDREGNLWVGTSSGLYQFRDLPLVTLAKPDGLPGDVVSSVWQTRNQALFAGTNEGLVRWSSPGSRPELVAKQQVYSALEDDSGSLWLGTAGDGLLRLAAGSTHPTPQPGPWGTKPIHSLAFDHSQTLLVATFGAGLYSCRMSAGFPCVSVPEARSDRVMALLPARNGDLWVGTREGLARRHHGRWERFTTGNGLRSNLITALHEDDDGSIWIGTEGGGLAHYQNATFSVMGSDQGLFDDIVYSIQEDQAGRFWMGSPRGLFRINKRQFADRRHPLTSVAYGLLDGMLATQCFADTPNAATRTPDGILWFGTMKGLVRIDPARLRTNPLPPPVLLEQVLIDGMPVPAQASVDVPPNSRRIEVDYTALSLTVPEKQRFRYRLEGYDDRWVEAGANRSLSYTNLPIGIYRLVVTASNDDGIWNESGTSLSIRWRPHFYQTPWFVLLVFASTGVAIALWYRSRLAQVEARHRVVLAERTRIAREIHDTYLQGFTGITLQLDALSRGLQDDQARQRLERLLSQADACLRQARESVWSLRRLDAPSFTSLPEQIRDTLQSVFATAGLPYTVQFDGTFPAVSSNTSSEWQRIVQEAASNIVRHAQATKVHVHVSADSQLCRLSMTDDGVGFDFASAQARTHHFGLRGMSERAAVLGGSCRVSSKPGSGAIVEVALPW